jgi:hypothetical protein
LAFGCLQFAQYRKNNICEKATGEFERKYERIGFLGFLKSRTEPNRTETGRFDSVSVQFFFKKKPVWLVFIGKNRTEPKIITPNQVKGYYS